jgi:hypothetical protein
MSTSRFGPSNLHAKIGSSGGGGVYTSHSLSDMHDKNAKFDFAPTLRGGIQSVSVRRALESDLQQPNPQLQHRQDDVAAGARSLGFARPPSPLTFTDYATVIDRLGENERENILKWLTQH